MRRSRSHCAPDHSGRGCGGSWSGSNSYAGVRGVRGRSAVQIRKHVEVVDAPLENVVLRPRICRPSGSCLQLTCCPHISITGRLARSIDCGTFGQQDMGEADHSSGLLRAIGKPTGACLAQANGVIEVRQTQKNSIFSQAGTPGPIAVFLMEDFEQSSASDPDSRTGNEMMSGESRLARSLRPAAAGLDSDLLCLAALLLSERFDVLPRKYRAYRPMVRTTRMICFFPGDGGGSFNARSWPGLVSASDHF